MDPYSYQPQQVYQQLQQQRQQRYQAPFPSSDARPSSHTPAYPSWYPPAPPQLPQQHSPQRHSHAGPPHTPPYGSKGRDYLRSLRTDVGNIDQYFSNLSVGEGSSPSPNRNKPLPPPPPAAGTNIPPLPTPPDVPPRPYSTGSPRYYQPHRPNAYEPPSVQYTPEPPRLVYQTATHTPYTHHTTSLPSQPTYSPHPDGSVTATAVVGPGPSRPTTTPPKSFRPSANILSPSRLRPPQSEPRLNRPHSDPTIPTTSSKLTNPTKAKTSAGRQTKKKPSQAIYVPDSDSEAYTTSSDEVEYITTRSPARRRRAESERPTLKQTRTRHLSAEASAGGPSSSSPRARTKSGLTTPSRSVGGRSGGTGDTVQCAGYTKEGQKCKRMVKAKAAYFDLPRGMHGATDGSPDGQGIGGGQEAGDRENNGERGEARYCKDHANLVIDQPGFSWMGTDVYIQFNDYIPKHLSRQTQAVLRVTMESPLTAKESPGYLYAYELRDLKTDGSVFFKVGRTDNPARRISEWTNRCKSHTPTLRDVYPLVGRSPGPRSPLSESTSQSCRNAPTPQRTPTLPTSYLLGAFRHSSNPDRICPASKRWERLVHLELADLALRFAPKEYDGLKKRCEECQAVHREVFPLGIGEGVYEGRVKEVICRWEGFVRAITAV